MPMVETSVAVATPSTTAARITNGSASAGSAIDEGAADLGRRRRARTWRSPRCDSATSTTTQSVSAEHQRPAAGRR